MSSKTPVWGAEMIEAADLDSECFVLTDGEIAVLNLESARQGSSSKFYQNPVQTGVAEAVIEHEQLFLNPCGRAARSPRGSRGIDIAVTPCRREIRPYRGELVVR